MKYLTAAVSFVLLAQVFGANWNYNMSSSKGPMYWANIAKACNGSKQSPIDIVTANVMYDKTLPALVPLNYHVVLPDLEYTIRNTGHTLNVEIKRNGNWTQSPVLLAYKNVPYRLFQFHFHWGSDDSHGSEHTIDNKSYAGEIHFVHYNLKYRTPTEALKNPDGVLVWGHFIKAAGTEENTKMDHVINQIQNVMYDGDRANIDPIFRIDDLIPPNSESKYYTYSGSLTTPGCQEVVTWIVNSNTITVSEDQIAKFRSVFKYNKTSGSTVKVEYNFRPPQPLNSRTVYKSFTDAVPQNGTCTCNNTCNTTCNTNAAQSMNTFQSFAMFLVLSLFFHVL